MVWGGVYPHPSKWEVPHSSCQEGTPPFSPGVPHLAYGGTGWGWGYPLPTSLDCMWVLPPPPIRTGSEYTPPQLGLYGVYPPQDWIGYSDTRTEWGTTLPPPFWTGWQLNTLCRGWYISCGFPREDFLVKSLLLLKSAKKKTKKGHSESWTILIYFNYVGRNLFIHSAVACDCHKKCLNLFHLKQFKQSSFQSY